MHYPRGYQARDLTCLNGVYLRILQRRLKQEVKHDNNQGSLREEIRSWITSFVSYYVKIPDKSNLTKAMVIFGSQFKERVHHDREVWEQELRSGSYCIPSQETEKDECTQLSSPFGFSHRPSPME